MTTTTGEVPRPANPPHDLQAEKDFLGTLLMSRNAIADSVEVFDLADFYRPAHERICTVVLELFARGEPVDVITVSAELTKREELAGVGGVDYIKGLVVGVPPGSDPLRFLKRIRNTAILRRLWETGQQAVLLATTTAVEDAEEVAAAFQAEAMHVTERPLPPSAARLETVCEGALDLIEAWGSRSRQLSGIPTGFTDLDTLTNGLFPGQLVVIASRAAMGKSTLALDILRSCSLEHGLPGVLFSPEMSAAEVSMRVLCAESGVAMHRMRSGNILSSWTSPRKQPGTASVSGSRSTGSKSTSPQMRRTTCSQRSCST